MNDSHQAFLKSLKDSEQHVWKVARWLYSTGLPVQVKQAGKAPTADMWKYFVDTGDLEISLRVEVKKRNLDFTTRDDYPYADVYVTAMSAYDQTYPKPYVYVILNKPETHAALVYTDTYHTWTVAETFDTRLNRRAPSQCYTCPKEEVIFVELNEHSSVKFHSPLAILKSA